MKRARKVALISVFDYPREDYSAYWAIEVSGDDAEGYRWAARLFSYEPLAWAWKGTRYTSRPEAPAAVYPPEVKVTQAAYKRMSAPDQAKVRARQDAWRLACAEVYEAAPQPVYLIDEALDVVKSRDEADAAAQSWVLERIGAYRRGDVPALSDEEVETLRAEFDAARARKDFGRCDLIRGRLKSRGVELTAPVNAGDSQRSSVHRQKGYALALGPAGLLGLAIGDALGAARDLVLMALGYSTTIRHNRLHQVRDAIDGGAGAGLMRIYDGSRPATCGTATTLLAELTHSDPCAGSASGGALTFSAITADASANATGTATWYRDVDSTGTCCVDGSVGTSGSDLNLNTTSINSGVQVSVSSKVYTGGNA